MYEAKMFVFPKQLFVVLSCPSLSLLSREAQNINRSLSALGRYLRARPGQSPRTYPKLQADVWPDVSLEFRNGTCALPWASAEITSPRALRLRLMFCASLENSERERQRERQEKTTKSCLGKTNIFASYIYLSSKQYPSGFQNIFFYCSY